MNRDNLEYVKNKIDNLLDNIYDTRDNLKRARNESSDGVIINGMSFCDDKILSDLNHLDLMIEKLMIVRNHCVQKIELIDHQKENVNISSLNLDIDNILNNNGGGIE